MVDAFYELHVTVETPQDQESYFEFYDKFQTDCAELKLKPICVGVAYIGGFRKFAQTALYIKADLDTAKLRLDTIATSLLDLGYQVIRKKVEAVANSLKGCLLRTEGDIYFETHIIVDMGASCVDPEGLYNPDIIEPLRILESLNVDIFNKYKYPRYIPLSFNLKKPNMCFVTLRGYNQTFEEHEMIITDVCDRIPFPKVKIIREITYYDTNQDIDSEPYPSNGVLTHLAPQ